MLVCAEVSRGQTPRSTMVCGVVWLLIEGLRHCTTCLSQILEDHPNSEMSLWSFTGVDESRKSKEERARKKEIP